MSDTAGTDPRASATLTDHEAIMADLDVLVAEEQRPIQEVRRSRQTTANGGALMLTMHEPITSPDPPRVCDRVCCCRWQPSRRAYRYVADGCLRALTTYAQFSMAALAAVVVWLLVHAATFYYLGVFDSRYFSFGPHPRLWFVGAVIDTWHRWMALVGVRVVGVCLETLVDDAIPRWVRTVFWNIPAAQKSIPYPVWQCRLIILAYDGYVIVVTLFRIYIFLLQADIALFVILAHLMTRQLCVVTHWLRGRKYRAPRDAHPVANFTLVDTSETDDNFAGLLDSH